MINTYIPYISKSERKLLNSCLNSTFISTAGPRIEQFENLFIKIFKFKYAVAVNSGTSALHLALLTSGIKKDDIVITPSYTFAATANAITYTGATPWFIDCDKKLILDISKVDKILKEKTIKKSNHLIDKSSGKIIRAILPVQTFGKSIEFLEYVKLAKKYNLKIIFDSAASHDPKIFNFKKSPNSIFCFSFNGNKTITTGAGGILATNSKKLASIARIYSTVGKKKSNYDYQKIGYNYKMPNIQASMGISQLKKLRKIINKKKLIFKYYNSNIKENSKYLKIYDKKFVNWVFALELKNSKIFKSLKKKFDLNKIQANFFWKPLHLQTPYKNFKKSNLSYSNKIWKKIFILPSHPGITKRDQKKICKILNF